MIFRFVYEMAGCKKSFTRLWISSMETGAIQSGFDNLKDGTGMTPSIILLYAGQRLTGLLALTQPVFSPACMERP